MPIEDLENWLDLAGAKLEDTTLSGGNILARFSATSMVMKSRKAFVVSGNGKTEGESMLDLFNKVRGCILRTPTGDYNTPWVSLQEDGDEGAL